MTIWEGYPEESDSKISKLGKDTSTSTATTLGINTISISGNLLTTGPLSIQLGHTLFTTISLTSWINSRKSSKSQEESIDPAYHLFLIIYSYQSMNHSGKIRKLGIYHIFCLLSLFGVLFFVLFKLLLFSLLFFYWIELFYCEFLAFNMVFVGYWSKTSTFLLVLDFYRLLLLDFLLFFSLFLHFLIAKESKL